MGGRIFVNLLSLVHLTHPHSTAFIHAQTTSKQPNRKAQSHQEAYVIVALSKVSRLWSHVSSSGRLIKGVKYNMHGTRACVGTNLEWGV